jgi:hypothetical protein
MDLEMDPGWLPNGSQRVIMFMRIPMPRPLLIPMPMPMVFHGSLFRRKPSTLNLKP